MAVPTDPLTVDRLPAVLELAVGGADADGAPLPCILRIRDLGDEVEVGWRSLEPGDHPLDGLCGFDAPPDWAAIGTLATGRLRHLDDPAAGPVPVRTAHLVARSGGWASWWEPTGAGAGSGPTVLAGEADDPSRPLGRIDDACRRALGLPTGPPSGGTGALFTLQWLDRIVEAAGASRSDRRGGAGGRQRRRQVLDWPAVARLHPAVDALDAAHALDPGAAPTPEELTGHARTLAAWRGWSVLRRLCADGSLALPDMPPAVAAWLDDGAFARWVLGAYPDGADLAHAVAALLPAPVTAAVCEVLAGSAGSAGSAAS